MYTEDTKRHIDWSSIIKKGLIFLAIVLVIFFIIWLFTHNKSNANINVNEGNSKNNETINPDNYSNEFINAYQYFHDTSKDYFLVNELPSEGNSIRYTLKTLTDKEILLPFIYKDNKTCDTDASYITIQNNDGKYTMTTTLICGKEIAKTTETLGCNQLCEGCCLPTDPIIPDDSDNSNDGKDQDYLIEYEYRQGYNENESVYTCPSGYTKTGTKCIKNSTSTIKPYIKTSYSCPAGYTKNHDGIRYICVKGSSDTVDPKVKYTYSCPSGYTKEGTGENTKCVKVSGTKTPAKYTTEYSCPSGYTKNGTKCTKTTTISATPNSTTTYSCPSGYTINGSKCIKNTSTSTNATAKTTYSCSSGTLNGTKCIISGTDVKNATSSTSYYCPSGEKIGNICRIYSNNRYYITTISYKGPVYNNCTYSGAYVETCGTNCHRTRHKYYCAGSYKDVAASSTTTYSCPSGYYRDGTKCYRSTNSTINATPKTTYSCSTGQLEGTKCVIYKTEYKDATANTTYSCPTGYNKSGTGKNTKCTKPVTRTIDATKIKKYYCDNDQTPSNGYCYSQVTDYKTPTKKPSYYCDNGYTLSNNKCVKNNTEKINATKNTEYFCKSGYKPIGEGANTKCTIGSSHTIDATLSNQNITKYRYKWSTETSIPGWERTGKTRRIPINSDNSNSDINDNK